MSWCRLGADCTFEPLQIRAIVRAADPNASAVTGTSTAADAPHNLATSSSTTSSAGSEAARLGRPRRTPAQAGHTVIDDPGGVTLHAASAAS
jgi:pectin methylesterase-like acyl-CoA thioesterase